MTPLLLCLIHIYRYIYTEDILHYLPNENVISAGGRV